MFNSMIEHTLMSCVTALTSMTGMAGWSSFSLDSAMEPVLMSHLAPWVRRVGDRAANLHEEAMYVRSLFGCC